MIIQHWAKVSEGVRFEVQECLPIKDLCGKVLMDEKIHYS